MEKLLNQPFVYTYIGSGVNQLTRQILTNRSNSVPAWPLWKQTGFSKQYGDTCLKSSLGGLDDNDNASCSG